WKWIPILPVRINLTRSVQREATSEALFNALSSDNQVSQPKGAKSVVHSPYKDDRISTRPTQELEIMKIFGSQLRRSSRDLGLSHYPRPDSAPTLHYTPIDQTVSPGSPVSLKCSAQGSPSPVITWTRDHQPLLPTHR
ncbi:hypothetical protein SK128_021785, partial [Halocaridina rubra]